MSRRIEIVTMAIMMLVTVGAAADLGGVVFKEDFSKYEVGDPITDWGTSDIVVLKTADDKTWIQAQTEGQHKAEKRLNLPNNFVFVFQFLNVQDFDVVFVDKSEETHVLSFANGRVFFQDTIRQSTDLRYDRIHTVKIIKKNKTFKLFIDDTFVLSSTPQAIGQINGISFKIQPKTKIGNIEITELIVE